MKSYSSLLTAVILCSGTTGHAAITEYTDRALFSAATGSTDIETFTDGLHYPISSGVLNSMTSCPDCTDSPLYAGDILPGATYATQVFEGTGNFFNIDTTNVFEGGFLDSLFGNGQGTGDVPRQLTITFDTLQQGIGFDTNYFMRHFTVSFYDENGALIGTASDGASLVTPQFFGFASSEANIASVMIAGSPQDASFNFALDNFTYHIAAVPEPASWAMMMTGLTLVAGALRTRPIRASARRA